VPAVAKAYCRRTYYPPIRGLGGTPREPLVRWNPKPMDTGIRPRTGSQHGVSPAHLNGFRGPNSDPIFPNDVDRSCNNAHTCSKLHMLFHASGGKSDRRKTSHVLSLTCRHLRLREEHSYRAHSILSAGLLSAGSRRLHVEGVSGLTRSGSRPG
jgi:hypothetical protein